MAADAAADVLGDAAETANAISARERIRGKLADHPVHEPQIDNGYTTNRPRHNGRQGVQQRDPFANRHQ